MKDMDYFILANPHAGHGHGRQVAIKVSRYLTDLQINHQLLWTQKSGDESQLMTSILAHKKTEDRILIIGGDGTLSLALNALPTHEAFAYIPAGSGNDFARAMGISRHHPIQTFQQLHQGRPQAIYVLNYQSEHFSGVAINNFGIGLDAAIVAAANHSQAKKVLNTIKLGQLAYLFSAFKAICHQEAFQVAVNGKTYPNTFLFTVTNHPYFGGGIPLAPDASLTNSDCHLVMLDKVSLPTLLALIPKVYQGKHLTHPHVTHLVEQAFDIQLDADQPLQIDGESHVIQSPQTIHLKTEKRTIIL